MKKQVNINGIQGSFFKVPIIMLFSISLLCSCNMGEKKEKLIPVNDLVDLLTEMYIADGLLSVPPIRAIYSHKDSTSNYIDIINRHGYSKVRMDNTMKYYFDRKPDKLQNIYDLVLTKLNEKQALLEKSEAPGLNASSNLWTGKEIIEVPESGIIDSAWFSIQVKDTGNYTLDFTTLIFADDQSLNPKVIVYFWRADSTKTGFRIYWQGVELKRDGKRHKYSITGRYSDSTITHIRGLLLDCDPQKGRWVKHSRIENISLRKIRSE